MAEQFINLFQKIERIFHIRFSVIARRGFRDFVPKISSYSLSSVNINYNTVFLGVSKTENEKGKIR